MQYSHSILSVVFIEYINYMICCIFLAIAHY